MPVTGKYTNQIYIVITTCYYGVAIFATCCRHCLLLLHSWGEKEDGMKRSLRVGHGRATRAEAGLLLHGVAPAVSLRLFHSDESPFAPCIGIKGKKAQRNELARRRPVALLRVGSRSGGRQPVQPGVVLEPANSHFLEFPIVLEGV